MADMNIQSVRAKFPQYQDMDDVSLAAALHKKYYGDMPFEEFAKRAGVQPIQHAEGAAGLPGDGPSTDEYRVNSGQKGDMRAGTKLNTKLGGKALQGISMNFGDEAMAGLVTPFVAAGNYFKGEGPTSLGEVYDQELAYERDQLQAAEDAHPIAAPLAEVGGALLTAKAPLGVISKARNLGQAAIASAGAGAAMGGMGGFGKGEGSFENRAGEAGKGAAIGLGVGLGTPYVGAGIGKVISPFKTSSARTQMADYLRSQGVDLTAGQRTGSNALRYAESEIGGQKTADMMERQGEQFTSAALKRVGTNANRATPDVIDDTFDRIGQHFDGLAARNSLEPDQKMLTDLSDVIQDYVPFVSESQRAPIIKNIVDDILKKVSLNGLNRTNADQGSSFQELLSSIYRAARRTNDPQLVRALRGIKDTLDDAMERSIGKNNPRDLRAWREARRQYHNLLAIEKATAGVGENSALGLISPSQLRNAIVQQSGRGYARGKRDFAELARAGEAAMKPLPNFGTPGRIAVEILRTGLPALIGSGVGASKGAPAGAMAGVAAGVMLPKIAGALMMTKPGQAYLSNQAASPGLRAIVNALLVSGGSTAGRLPSP